MIDPHRTQGASNEAIRDFNRRIVLNLIRTRQPVSRADLARVSGLQRSTISLIVEQLIEESWVMEGPTGRLPRGRRPTYLRLNDDHLIVGVDIRPSQITIALADINGKFSKHEILNTPPDPRTALQDIIERIQRMVGQSKGKNIDGIGISVPGRISPESGRLVFAPNLKWPAVDISTPIAKATGLPVETENAANACVLAAVWFDHLEFCRNLVVLTVSEGIGTGLLVNGQLARGRNAMAGEFGHVTLDPNGPVCSCGGRGCWEVYASNQAAIRYYVEGSNATEKPTFPQLLGLADHGNKKAIAALERMAEYLGRGMRMIVAGLAPERVIVVGELTRSWHRFGPVIEAEVQAQTLQGGSAPRVTPAHEDGIARLRGTVALVLQREFGLGSQLVA